MQMYLSTLFLSEIENGVQQAIAKCNEEFLSRSLQNHITSKLNSSADRKFLRSALCDEIVALWDVFQDYQADIPAQLPVITAMNTVCAARVQSKA